MASAARAAGGDDSPQLRLKRLQVLIDRLERLPATPESEWMLREARARRVDVETGDRPSEMRPLVVHQPDEAHGRHRDAAVKPPTKPRSSVSERRQEPARRSRSSEPETPLREVSIPLDLGAGGESSAAPFGSDGLLWLDDSPGDEGISPDKDGGDLTSQPWRRGLRG
jgi:hypothetical protein